MEILQYLYFGLFCFVILMSFVTIFHFRTKHNIVDKIKHYESYLSVLEYYMKKAYDIIYKDRILVYSIEGMKISDEDFYIISKDFALLVMKLIGDNLKNEFIEFYGNEDVLIFNMMEYFNQNFENDEIRETAKENIMNSSQPGLTDLDGEINQI